MKLSLIGSNGAIGQPLALLLAQSSRIAELSIYDIVDQQGVAMDLDHIDRDCRVESSRTVEECIRGSEIVVLSAGVPRKPGMTRDDLFQINASIVADISKSVAKHASSAFFAIITNPVNSNVPIACKVFEKCGQKSTDKIFGVTTLDIMRANTFIGKLLNKRAQDIFCPIVGGHSGETIIPLFSKAVHRKGDDIDLINSCNQADLKHLESQIQTAGTDVVNAKKNGSASLSMAAAGYRFVMNLIRAINGPDLVKEYCHVNLKPFKMPYGNYFSLPMLIGKNGIEEVIGLEGINDYEQKRISETVDVLAESESKVKGFIDNYEI